MGCRIETAPWSPAVYPRSHPPPPRDRWSWWRQPAGSYCRCLWTPLRNYPSQFVLVSWISARGPPSANRYNKLSRMKIPKGNHQGGMEKEWKGLGKVPRDLPRFSPNFAGMLQWRKFQRILRRPGQGNKIVSPNFVGEPLETTQLSRFRQTFKTRLDTEEFSENWKDSSYL